MQRTIVGIGSGLALTAALALAPAGAAAQGEDEPFVFMVDGMVSGPLGSPTDDQYDVGGAGFAGVYRAFVPEVLFGIRAGGGSLSGGRAVPQDPIDRGPLDWASLSAAARVRPFGGMMDLDRRATSLWIELGIGPWLVDGEVDPVFDAAVGYGIALGPVVLAPNVRFFHIVESHGRYGDWAPMIGSAGLEVAWNDRIDESAIGPTVMVAEQPPNVVRSEPPAAPAPLAPEEDVARPFVNDQLVIDERVFFDYDRWELRPTGIAQLREVVRRYEESGDRWAALVVSGHADRRGPEDYNVQLSRKRAEAVRRFLTENGVPTEVLELQAWGESRPEIPDAETEAEHQVNRRVQFEIVWRPGMRPEGVAPEPHPTQPDYVDPAPEGRRDLP